MNPVRNYQVDFYIIPSNVIDIDVIINYKYNNGNI